MGQPTFEEYVAVRGEALLRFALMLTGNRDLAEDLTQSALAKAYPRWRRIAAMDQPEAYLKKVLLNDHLRWWRRRSRAESPVAEVPEAQPVADGSVALARRDAAWTLLARLPKRQRAVLVLRYYEDLSDEQIAVLLGTATATVRSQASRALATLRAALPTLDKEALP